MEPIQELIPQRPPFIMVDRLISCNSKGGLTEYQIPLDNCYVENKFLSPSGLIENMAQSCAARIGHVNRHREGAPQGNKIGVIGEIRDLEIIRRPKVNDILHTEITIVEEIFNLTLAEVVSKVNSEIIATARFKIALADV